jgi:glycosyltransferase involved in cell wall biosynthesis
MKVLQINSVCGYGSTGRITTDIYKVLEEQGHECLIAYGRGTAPKEINSIRIGTNIDNYIHVTKTRIFDKHGFSSTKATKKFIKKIKEFNPDVIHLHNLHGYYINIKILFNYLKAVNKPVIWTLHDCWSFTGHCSHFDLAGCEKWKSGCYKCLQKKEYPKCIGIDKSSRNYRIKKSNFLGVKNLVIVAPSKWLADLVEKSFLGKYPIKVIHNGIDLDIFKPTNGDFKKRYDIDKKFMVLGVAQNWSIKKGFDIFINLSNKLSKNYKIVLVGLSKKRLKQLPDNIIGIESINSIDDLVEIFSQANIFANPTLEDTFPTVNLEALACGVPIVTFNTGGSTESIDDNCGLAVEKGNVNLFLNAIEKLCEKKIPSSICIQRAQMFKKDQKYNEYIDLYKNLTNVQDRNYNI